MLETIGVFPKHFVIHSFNNGRGRWYEGSQEWSLCCHLSSWQWMMYHRHIPLGGPVEPMILRKATTHSHS